MTTKTERLPKFLALGIWIFAVILMGTALGIFLKKQSREQEQVEYENWLVDLASEKEVLHPALEEAVKNDENFEYVTSTTQSKYTEVLGKYLYDDENGNKDTLIANALASGAGILIGRKVYPEDFVFNTDEELVTVKDVALKKYGLELIKKSGMNSNILNYYLDKGGMVVIYAKGDAPYSEDGRAVLVFGGYLVDGLYVTFSPKRTYEPEDGTRTSLIPKTTLFETIKSDEQFFVLMIPGAQ